MAELVKFDHAAAIEQFEQRAVVERYVLGRAHVDAGFEPGFVAGGVGAAAGFGGVRAAVCLSPWVGRRGRGGACGADPGVLGRTGSFCLRFPRLRRFLLGFTIIVAL